VEATDGKKLKNLDLENCEVLVQDESAFVSDVSQYNWSRKGVKAVYRGYRYGTRINCFGSLNINNGNIILTKEIRGNSHTMINHLNVVRKHYPIEKKLIIFTDNASWHKTKKVTEYCEANNIELWFTPPYAPEFNPIERVWSFMKSIVKKEIFITADSFNKFITELFSSIQNKHEKQLRNLCCSLI
jgi:transposase